MAVSVAKGGNGCFFCGKFIFVWGGYQSISMGLHALETAILIVVGRVFIGDTMFDLWNRHLQCIFFCQIMFDIDLYTLNNVSAISFW